MGLFGFLSEGLSATTKIVLTPLAVVKDIVDGEPFETTGSLLESATEDIGNAIDEILPE